ncbi:MAG: hypothetical protein HYZ39_19205 [Mycolicibacterium cosmeticum]|nr:hypothetical protein [Mycolicibacterium cosmeticum]
MSDTQTGPEATETPQLDEAQVTTPETDPAAPEGDTGAHTFPRAVAEKLRKESATYRDRAKTAEARVDELSHALFQARVAATGKLADATDIAYNAKLIDDPEALVVAIDDLLSRKPHLKARSTTGDIGQGQRGDETAPTDFSTLFR